MKYVLIVSVVLCGAVASHGAVRAADENAQQTAPSAAADATSAPPRFGTGLAGQMVFVQHCATCHADTAVTRGAEGRAPTLTSLQQLPPERALDALVSGKMVPVGSQLSDAERRAVAEWLGGRPLGAGAAGDVGKMIHRCAVASPVTAAAAGDWNGWGVDGRNSRYQPEAGFSVAQITSLKLRWAFGFPGGAEAYSQPTVVGGHVFIGGDNGYVYGLQAKSGCAQWSFQAKAGVRTAPSVAPLKPGSHRQAVFFGDMKGYAYALDAVTGKEIWITRVDDQPMVKITGAPAVHDGRLYVGTSTGEEVTAASPTYECCRTRGTVVALDTANGKVIWKTYLVQEAPKPAGKNGAGTTRWAPAGVGQWSAPTVDIKRHLLYVTTGDAYTEPAAPLSDSIVALGLNDGKVAWHHQDTHDDAWLAGCMPGRPFGNCPKNVGPDWDFGASAILVPRKAGDLLVGAHKGGFVVAVDPARDGKLVWRQGLAIKPAGAGGEIVFGGASDGTDIYYGLSSGAVIAVSVEDGTTRWRVPVESPRPDRNGISSAVTVMPGVLFTGAWDGVLRAYATDDGRLLWSFDTVRSFDAVNGVPAKGGSMGAPGPTLAAGMLFVSSGYIGVGNGMPGNVLLAFAPD
jgi:polyvinyl alcohol dehydrogenase (cytochrome)